jgi:hypothetical protein
MLWLHDTYAVSAALHQCSNNCQTRSSSTQLPGLRCSWWRRMHTFNQGPQGATSIYSHGPGSLSSHHPHRFIGDTTRLSGCHGGCSWCHVGAGWGVLLPCWPDLVVLPRRLPPNLILLL